MDDYKYYCDYVDLIAKTLKFAGHNVVHFKHVNVIKLEYEGTAFYVGTFPVFNPYLENIIICKIKKHSIMRGVLLLEFSSGRGFGIRLRPDSVTIYDENSYIKWRGTDYKPSAEFHTSFIGRLNGREFIDRENKWFSDDNALNAADFTPAKSQTVDIENIGVKSVVSWPICHVKNSFTIFATDHVIDGIYKESGRDDIFKCVNEDGELFAQLYDEHCLILASAARIIHTVRMKDLIVSKAYNGYELTNDKGKIITEPKVCRFNDIFFKCSGRVEVYEARKPNSGKHTKMAIKFETN